MSVSAENKITLLKTLTTSFNVGSISNMDDNTFLVGSLDDPRPVRSIDITGKERDIHHLQLPNKTYKNSQFACSYIPSSKTVLLSDREQNVVYVCNNITDEIREIKDGLISEPRCLCVGPQDAVFVCSANTSSIVQLSSTGDVIQSLNLNMYYPRAVTVSNDGTRLVVSNSPYGQKMIKLFRIE